MYELATMYGFAAVKRRLPEAFDAAVMLTNPFAYMFDAANCS